MPISELAFDHLVILTREHLSEYANSYQHEGFYLSPLSTHTIGSSNQLIVLDTSYIELLGWTVATHTIRPDIKDRPVGADALVFRVRDAQRCYDELRHQGFLVNPVQRLVRLATIEGVEQEVRFNTVRFTHEPIPGIRVYFCEHLTPAYVWHPHYQQHANQATRLERVDLSMNLDHAYLLAKIVGVPLSESSPLIRLSNMQLAIQIDETLFEANIHGAHLVRHNNSALPLTLPPNSKD